MSFSITQTSIYIFKVTVLCLYHKKKKVDSATLASVVLRIRNGGASINLELKSSSMLSFNLDNLEPNVVRGYLIPSGPKFKLTRQRFSWFLSPVAQYIKLLSI